ncbi:MAG: zinc ribbon domain-containing protein [Anaerolineae bacterium]|nr:zinc ribbon domain-containing protein [Anaerolineae bacterium]
MPIFEYECPDCGDSFEKLVRSTSSTAKVVCPQCGSVKPRRKLSAFAASVRGGGGSVSSSDCGSSGGT